MGEGPGAPDGDAPIPNTRQLRGKNQTYLALINWIKLTKVEGVKESQEFSENKTTLVYQFRGPPDPEGSGHEAGL